VLNAPLTRIVLASPLPQPYPATTAILGNELHAGRLKGALDGLEIIRVRRPRTALKIDHRLPRDLSSRRKIGLAPLDQRARGSRLSSGNFKGQNQSF
jgi:hypothetical protein